MKTLVIAGLFVYAGLASAFTVYTPEGVVDVTPTGYGFNVLDLRKNRFTLVTKTDDGYVIFPEGESPTFIQMNPGDEKLEHEMILPSLINDDRL